MGLVHRETGSGLVLAEEAQDEATITRALKQINPELALQRDGAYYKVVCITGWDHPDQIISCFTWADEHGNPLPLSSGLVEEANKWRPEARGRRGPSADEHNARIKDETEQLRRDQLAAISDDHRAFVERNRLGVALDAKPKKRYWQRGHRPPQSGGPRR